MTKYSEYQAMAVKAAAPFIPAFQEAVQRRHDYLEQKQLRDWPLQAEYLLRNPEPSVWERMDYPDIAEANRLHKALMEQRQIVLSAMRPVVPEEDFLGMTSAEQNRAREIFLNGILRVLETLVENVTLDYSTPDAPRQISRPRAMVSPDVR